MQPFIVPTPDMVKPNDRSTFDGLWKEITKKEREIARQMMWLSIMDQLVEGHAAIELNYDYDETGYVVCMELMEQFKEKGFITKEVVDYGVTSVVIEMPIERQSEFLYYSER